MQGAPTDHMTGTLPRAAGSTSLSKRGPSLTSAQSGQENKMNWILISKGERVRDSTDRHGGGNARHA